MSEKDIIDLYAKELKLGNCSVKPVELLVYGL